MNKSEKKYFEQICQLLNEALDIVEIIKTIENGQNDVYEFLRQTGFKLARDSTKDRINT